VVRKGDLLLPATFEEVAQKSTLIDNRQVPRCDYSTPEESPDDHRRRPSQNAVRKTVLTKPPIGGYPIFRCSAENTSLDECNTVHGSKVTGCEKPCWATAHH
jgi:hypothetical protein